MRAKIRHKIHFQVTIQIYPTYLACDGVLQSKVYVSFASILTRDRTCDDPCLARNALTTKRLNSYALL